MSSFYTCVPKITFIWCMLPEICEWKTIFLSFWVIFCPFTPLLTPKIKVCKKCKKTWRYYPFTNVFHEWRSHDVWLNWQHFLSFWAIFSQQLQQHQVSIQPLLQNKDASPVNIKIFLDSGASTYLAGIKYRWHNQI